MVLNRTLPSLMGSMGSRARLWLDTPSMALKRVLLMEDGEPVDPNAPRGMSHILDKE